MQDSKHPSRNIVTSLASTVLASVFPATMIFATPPAAAQGVPPVMPLQTAPAARSSIQSFEIRGVSSLGAADVRAATAPYVGWEQTTGNVKKAIESIEALYRSRGMPEVKVYLAGEDKARGLVVIDVVEPAAQPLVPAASEPERFVIRAFEVKGVAALTPEEVRSATEKFVGVDKSFGDIQQTVDAIDNLYRSKGYGAVQVLLPEQDISQGTVVLQVIETPIEQVLIKGNQKYSAENIRRSIPALLEGSTPNAKKISQNVQLANENQGKQVEVVLAVGAKENTVDAKLNVREDEISRIFVTADNTGTEPTGNYRMGVGYLHNNVFDRDHTASIAYTGSPDEPDGVDIHVLSFGYRVPLYSLGDSVSFVYGYSDVATPTAQTTGFAINGKGNLAALRYNHYLPRQGEFSSQLIAGIDWKDIQSSCIDTNGAPINGAAGCVDYATTPLSLTFTGRKDGIGSQYDYSIGGSYNLPSGPSYAYSLPDGSSGTDRYTLAAGNRKSNDSFSVLRMAGSFTAAVFRDWLARIAVTGQYNGNSALVSSEQIGLAGSQAVRGFLDRVVIADSGAVINLEAYSPEIAPLIGLPKHNLRALVFADYAYGRDNNTNGLPPVKELGSAGVGLRYQYQKDVSFKLDAASILIAEPEGVYRGTDPAGGVLDQHEKGDWRVHGSLMLSF